MKKVLSLLLALVFVLSLIAGCGNLGEIGDSEKPQAGVANENAKNGTLIMGTNAAFEPFEFVTTEADGLVGEFDGIDVAIALELATAMDKELRIEDMEFEGLLASVQTGKIDMAVAGMTVNEERKKSVDFSIPYYKASQVMVVAADNDDIKSAEDIKSGKTVGVVLGYTGDSIVTDTLKVDENKITRANRGIDIVQDVKNGKLDVVVIDSYTGKALAEKNGLKVIEDATTFEAEEYAIAVKKGNTELLDQINKVLEEMIASGKIDEIAQKYN